MVWLDEGGRGRGDSHLVAPPASLASWVEHFWIHTGNSQPIPGRWRIVPDFSPHLIFAVESLPGRGERTRCTLVGSRETYDDIDVSRRVLTIGARLRLGALASLARSPASAFTGRAFRADDVFGPAGRALADRMAADMPHAMQQLIAFLEERFAPCEADLRFEAVIRSARSVASLQCAMGLSPRAVWNRTTDTTGLAPRRLLRIIRLHRALRHAATNGSKWTDTAYLSGYADQAHMIREFIALLGESPNSWIGRATADSFNTIHPASLQI